MVARLLDRTLLECLGDKAVEMCGPSAFISWISHLVHVRILDRLLGRALSERVSGRALENSPSAFRSALILRFPLVINLLMYGHVRATRNIPQDHDNALEASHVGRYYNFFLIFPIARTRPYSNNYISLCLVSCTGMACVKVPKGGREVRSHA